MFRIIQKNTKNQIKYVRYFKRPVVPSDLNPDHPKNNWKIKGQLCKNCWDAQKAQLDRK